MNTVHGYCSLQYPFYGNSFTKTLTNGKKGLTDIK